MIYTCCDELRRNAVAAHATLNGIDYLEVLDADAPPGSPRQQTLLVRLLKAVPADVASTQVRLTGGERVRDVGVEWVAPASDPPALASPAEQAYLAALPDPADVLVVRTDGTGDFSRYRLSLVRSPLDGSPPAGFDPRLAEVEFSFKVECPSDFDCRPVATCAEEAAAAPVIDYLAKDYPSFRRLILDRLTQLVPGWRESSAADVGVTLAELLAYVGDQLSYQQDAVATEAYLQTCRLRTSLRRHALLVDYHVHDGCNARAWLHVRADAGPVALAKEGTRFYTSVPGLPERIAPGSRNDTDALLARPVVFEPVHDAVLHQAHNRISLYTWGDGRCCLPAGATTATLRGHLPFLDTGDATRMLLFEEVLGPLTGEPEDADPRHRHVVALTAVHAFSSDDPAEPLVDPLTGDEITEIVWDPADQLPFPLCVSSVTDEAHGDVAIDDVSVARGNLVLADHGHTLPHVDDLAELIGTMPPATLAYAPDPNADHCGAADPTLLPARFRPTLSNAPLTFAGTVATTSIEAGQPLTVRVAFDPDAAAVAATQWRMDDTLPAIELHGSLAGVSERWWTRRDLLNSKPDDPHVVVEVEHDGRSLLRFGDGVLGKRPEAGTVFRARYRIGNGAAGNIGPDTIAHVVSADPATAAVRNPLAAVGGVDMEEAARVRRRAPHAFRRQERAVTTDDYAEVIQRHPGVQRAAATFRWTGSWHTVFVTVDRAGGLEVDNPFEAVLTRHVDRYRMAGHDTEFNDPVFVSLEMDLLVCVESGYLRSAVQAGLAAALGSRRLPDGRRGLFHPDRLTFGQTVFLSPIYAAARQVAGVGSVLVTRFHRQGDEDPVPLSDGFMRLSRLEIARLDNDPNFPEHGVLRLTLLGGS